MERIALVQRRYFSQLKSEPKILLEIWFYLKTNKASLLAKSNWQEKTVTKPELHPSLIFYCRYRSIVLKYVEARYKNHL